MQSPGAQFMSAPRPRCSPCQPAGQCSETSARLVASGAQHPEEIYVRPLISGRKTKRRLHTVLVSCSIDGKMGNALEVGVACDCLRMHPRAAIAWLQARGDIDTSAPLSSTSENAYRRGAPCQASLRYLDVLNFKALDVEIVKTHQ